MSMRHIDYLVSQIKKLNKGTIRMVRILGGEPLLSPIIVAAVKSFEKINKNLNKDSFAVPIHDLVISDETYIVYYHYFENDVKYIYYME